MLTDEYLKWLDAANLVEYRASSTGGDAFLEALPNDPAAAVAVYATGGRAADVKGPMGRPGWQVIVRGGTDPRAACDRAQALMDYTHGQTHVTLTAGGTTVLLMTVRESMPTRLGPDANGRHRFAFNVEALTGSGG